MKNIWGLMLIGFILSGCKTQLVYMTVTQPAPVSIPKYVQKVGILNRSLPSEDNKLLNTVDMVLSEKGPELDKEGGKESIRGVKDALMQNNRFSNVLLLDSIRLKTPGAGIFPTPLSWDVVENICKGNKIEAIFALELFATNSTINVSTSPVTLKGPLGLDVPAVETHASMVTTVKTGWRIYDWQSRTILDEFPTSQSMTFSSKGINPLKATEALLSRKEAVKQTGYQTGQFYARRILPYNLRVSRDYYVKGNANFKTATRMARTGNWDGAAEIWQKETTNRSVKLSSRGCYNMAIISEINGDLDAAIKWAQKSYETGGKRLALEYLNILKNRSLLVERLKNQGE
jgi:hypothetical protein